MRHISNQHGFVLIAGLILMTVLATIALGSFAVSNTEVQVSANYRSSVQAVTLAEGALAQVIYWFNNPTTFTDTSVSYHASTPAGAKGAAFFTKRRSDSRGRTRFFSPNTRLSQFYDVNDDGTGDMNTSPALEYKSSIAAQKTFLDTTFAVLSTAGNITNIRVVGSPNSEEVALVQVTAQSKGGGTATIEAVLGPTPGGNTARGFEVGASGAFAGKSAKVHWSDSVIVGNIDFQVPQEYNPPQLACGTGAAAQPDNKLYGVGGAKRIDDPWNLVKVGGTVTTSGGGCAGIYNYCGLTPCPQPLPNTIPLRCAPVATPQYYSNVLPGLNNDLIATNNVSIGKIPYEETKTVAKKTGFYKVSTYYQGYYYTRAGIEDTVYDAAGTPYLFQPLINGMTKGMIFVDTKDQRIPNAAGTNLQTLAINTSTFVQGNVFLAANPKISGLGGGTDINVQSPPWNNALPVPAPLTWEAACTAEYLAAYCSVPPPGGWIPPVCTRAAGDRKPVTNLSVHFKGLVYIYGITDITGNMNVFGALIAERGYTGAGTPEVWFDYDLKSGNPNVSPVFIRYWREVGAS